MLMAGSVGKVGVLLGHILLLVGVYFRLTSLSIFFPFNVPGRMRMGQGSG